MGFYNLLCLVWIAVVYIEACLDRYILSFGRHTRDSFEDNTEKCKCGEGLLKGEHLEHRKDCS